MAFIVRESRTPNPLVPLHIFRSRAIAGANAVQVLTVAGLFGMFFLGVLYLQRVLGYDALETGLAFLPVSVLIGILSLGFSARLSQRYGATAVLLPGLVLIAVGLLGFARVPVDGSYLADVLPVMIPLGIGAGLFFPALTTLAMSGVSPSESGLASGLVNTSLQVGGAIGLAVLATLSATRSEKLLADGESTASALTSGYHLAFVIAAGLVVAAIGVALTVLRGTGSRCGAGGNRGRGRLRGGGAAGGVTSRRPPESARARPAPARAARARRAAGGGAPPIWSPTITATSTPNRSAATTRAGANVPIAPIARQASCTGEPPPAERAGHSQPQQHEREQVERRAGDDRQPARRPPAHRWGGRSRARRRPR